MWCRTCAEEKSWICLHLLDCSVILELWSWRERPGLRREDFKPSGCTEWIKVLCLKWSGCDLCSLLRFTIDSTVRLCSNQRKAKNYFVSPNKEQAHIQMINILGINFTFTLSIWILQPSWQKLKKKKMHLKRNNLQTHARVSHWHHLPLITAVLQTQVCNSLEFMGSN